MRDRLGIYIHIPFCASKCNYCDFCSYAGYDHLILDYQDALIAHIEETSSAIKNYEIDTIYFGGGTPSYYGADKIAEILDVLKLNGNVRLDSEITVECNPDSLSYTALKLMRTEGVNRISLGVQATDNDLLKVIGRRHNFMQAQNAVEDARRAGFDNVSVDMIYGLPTQSKRDWAESLGLIIEMHPEHISCYGLKLEPGTKMHRDYFGSPILPDEDVQADMYSFAADMLKRYGYRQYEISNFCIPGYESRHNMKYWTLQDYMGFGPGAHSGVGKLRYSFIRDLKGYISAVKRGARIVDEYEEIDELGRATEYIMLGMRTSRGISEKEYRDRCRSDWTPIREALEVFVEKGWAEEEDGRWHFTVPGYLISNTLILIFLEAQTGKRIRSMPWLRESAEAGPRTEYPLSEEEHFAKLYKEILQDGGN